MVLLGVIYHALGGGAAGSFYIPLKKVKEWSWESAWLINGIFSWIIVPLVVALFAVEQLAEVLRNASYASLGWTAFFGILWGIGGLSFGLSVRYLGMSLGYGVALGFCAAFGTIIPTIYDGTFMNLLSTTSGNFVLLGVITCLVGIAVCGYAGHLKEQKSAQGPVQVQQEFNLLLGLTVAGFAGIMSACMAFAFAAGKPIAEMAKKMGTDDLWVNNSVLVVILLGGFLTNAIYCIYLNLSKGTWRDYRNKKAPLKNNYSYAALAGVTWYLQFMFYGMGSTQMGKYDFSSWTLHMSFIIIASNIWSLFLKEWVNCEKKAVWTLLLGIAIITLATVFIGLGNYLGTL
jgi:L-rhamnose-H+ transport protein